MPNQNEIKEPEDFDLRGNHEAKCPYCGFDNYVESCDFRYEDDSEEMECSKCEREFMVLGVISVYYNTSKKEAPDAESK